MISQGCKKFNGLWVSKGIYSDDLAMLLPGFCRHEMLGV